jgi:hypothetical protein
MRAAFVFIAVVLAGICQGGIAAEAESSAATAVEAEVTKIAADVAALQRDVKSIEEDMLFPASSRLVVFVGAEPNLVGRVQSVSLAIDGRVVTEFMYTNADQLALERGGAHRLYVGNAAPGTVRVSATFRGERADGKPYERSAELALEKAFESGVVEFKLLARSTRGEPDIAVHRSR